MVLKPFLFLKQTVSRFYFKAAKEDEDRALNGVFGAIIYSFLFFTYILIKRDEG